MAGDDDDPFRALEAAPQADADEDALRPPAVLKAATGAAGLAGLFGVGSLLQGFVAIAWAPAWVWALLSAVGASGAAGLLCLLGVWRLRPAALAGALAANGALAVLGAAWCLGAAASGLFTPAPVIASALATVALALLVAAIPAVRAGAAARRRLASEGLDF